MTDEELASAWEAGDLGRAVGHLEHVRIAVVLLRRHGAAEAERRLVAGTLRNCRLAGAEERFDEDLTRRWAQLLADTHAAAPDRTTGELLDRHPELSRGDLLGAPAWKRAPAAAPEAT